MGDCWKNVSVKVVVSWIFRVTGLLEHELANMYLQNKQENGGGAPAASPMPKSGQEIWRMKGSVFFSQESRTFLVVIPPSFMEEEDDPIYMESE